MMNEMYDLPTMVHLVLGEGVETETKTGTVFESDTESVCDRDRLLIQTDRVSDRETRSPIEMSVDG